MNILKHIFLIIGLFFIGACAGNSLHRVNNATNVPRATHIDSASFRELGGVLFGELGFQHGMSWSDSGNIHESDIFSFGAEVKPTKELGIGWTPFLGFSTANVEDNDNWGSEFYLRYRFLQNPKSAHSIIIRYVNSTNASKNFHCEDTTIFFPCSGTTGTLTEQAYVFTRVLEPGFGTIHEWPMGKRNSFAIAPMIYYTQFYSKNVLKDNETLLIRRNRVNYSAFLYYVART